MSVQFQSARGTNDILPNQVHIWQNIEKMFLDISNKYGFNEIRVPTFEHTELFLRSVGDTTDVVEKEMYTFFDKSNRSLTLKPEGTAGVARSVIQHSLLNNVLPLKLFYITPCFRYDKPQAGRLREFHQFGVESYGSESFLADIEVICIANDVFKTLNLQSVNLEINSIGCKGCRPNYNKNLKEYLLKNENKFCNDCKSRIHTNPMRILDCKNPSCKNLIEDAPKTIDYLCNECNSHFSGLKNALGILNISYKINDKIVRGLDYYTKTVFEFVTDKLGAQSTICGGGRYDYLIETMGYKRTAGVGFGLGIERLILLLDAEDKNVFKSNKIDIYIGAIDDVDRNISINLAKKLRDHNISCEVDLMNRSVKAQMKYADKICAKYSCIIGENERINNKLKIKNMQTKTEIETDFSSIINILKEGF